MDKIYLIYNDSMGDFAEIKGVIIGTQDQAKQWCKSYNAGRRHDYEKVWHTELEVLNKDVLDREVYYIVDRNSKDAWVSSKPLNYLTIGELEGIDRDGHYFSTKEKAMQSVGK